MAEHMRISLIDPRWREQRETMMAKIRDTTKVRLRYAVRGTCAVCRRCGARYARCTAGGVQGWGRGQAGELHAHGSSPRQTRTHTILPLYPLCPLTLPPCCPALLPRLPPPPFSPSRCARATHTLHPHACPAPHPPPHTQTRQASDDEITRNIVGLARTRPDIFGSTEEELQQVGAGVGWLGCGLYICVYRGWGCREEVLGAAAWGWEPGRVLRVGVGVAGGQCMRCAAAPPPPLPAMQLVLEAGTALASRKLVPVIVDAPACPCGEAMAHGCPFSSHVPRASRLPPSHVPRLNSNLQAVKDEIRDKMMSGVGRPVAWDGATQGGDGLQHQIRAIHDSRADMADRGGPGGGAGAPAIPQIGRAHV